MDINLLLKGIKCSCGKTHSCPIKYVFIERHATKYLPKILERKRNPLIVCDENTYRVAGEEVINVLGGMNIKLVKFPGYKLLIPNEDAINTVTENLDKIDFIIGIGSGVIQDLCKYVSFKSKIPYCIVATAPSMDGYASSGAAMILSGMKETVKSTLPLAILGDPEVLRNAPIEMIRAGFGDIIGKYSALCDWKLSQIVNEEYFCKYIYDLTMKQINVVSPLAKKIIELDINAVSKLFEALVIVGILMSFAESSRPASGSEHHLSHFFEITGIVFNRPYLSHGIDVGYATVVTSKIREKILTNDFSQKQINTNKEELYNELHRVYGKVADGCIKLQEKIGRYEQNRIPIYKEKEDKIREVLQETPSQEEIMKILEPAGYKLEEFYKFYGENILNDAIKYAKDLKDRYTVLWMLYDLFGGNI